MKWKKITQGGVPALKRVFSEIKGAGWTCERTAIIIDYGTHTSIYIYAEDRFYKTWRTDCVTKAKAQATKFCK